VTIARPGFSRILAACLGALILLGLTSLYPLTIDDNSAQPNKVALVCGGLTGRIAVIGAVHSSEGEPSSEDKAVAKEHAARCQVKARELLLGAAGIGAVTGFSLAWLRERGMHRAHQNA